MKEKRNNILPWIVCGAVVLIWLVFYLLRVEKLLDADMASEMVLSDLLAKEHRIISPNWKYSTEIRVLNNQIFFSLFMLLTGSYRISRLISGVVLLAVYALSYYYFCKQAGLRKMYPYTLALLFLPVSADYAYIILYGLYYIPHVAISFTSIAMMLHIRHTAEKKKKLLLMAGLFVLAMAAGMGGPRQLVICYIPMLLLFILEGIREKKAELPGALIAFAGGAVGYAINATVLYSSYHFNSWGNLNFTGFSMEKASGLLMGVFHEYGYVEGSAFSVAMLTNVCAFLILGCLIHYYVCVFAKGGHRTAEERITAKLVLVMAAVYFLLYLFTDMFYEDRYALLFTVFAAPIIGFSLKSVMAEKIDKDAAQKEKKGAVLWRYMVPLLGITAILVGSLCNYYKLAITDIASPLREISDQLVAQGYNSGYASYWNGNIMTELSEGRFEMYNWDDYVTEKIDVEELYLWLQPMSHEEKKPEGKVFILLSTQEESECPLVRYLTEADEAARNDDYVAYGFTDYENMLSALSDFEYDLKDGAWLAGNGVAEHGTWVMSLGSITNGPNITLYAGDYEMLIEGSGLDRITYDVTAEFGEVLLKDTMVENDAEHMKLSISVPENTYHVELHLKNITPEDIVIKKISIQRTGGVDHALTEN